MPHTVSWCLPPPPPAWVPGTQQQHVPCSHSDVLGNSRRWATVQQPPRPHVAADVRPCDMPTKITSACCARLHDVPAKVQAVASSSVTGRGPAAPVSMTAPGAWVAPAEWCDPAGRLMLKNMRRSELERWSQQSGAGASVKASDCSLEYRDWPCAKTQCGCRRRSHDVLRPDSLLI